MKPTPQITFPKALFVIVLIILILIEWLPQVIQRSHDEPLDLVVQTHHFTYKVSTYTNTRFKRCALIRCGHQFASRLHHHSHCDAIFAEIVQANHNKSTQYCAIDYIYTQWNSLSRTYNNGIYYISNDVKLRFQVEELPLDQKAVQFSASEDNLHISTAWIAIKPSNLVRQLFADWHDAMNNPNITIIKRLPLSMNALNSARTCQSTDVVCHTRVSVIAWQCSSVRKQLDCMSTPYSMIAVRMIGVAVTIVIILSTIITMVSKALPRMRGALGTPVNAHLVSIPLTHVLIIGCILLFAGEEWIFIVKTLARLFGVFYKHELHQEPFNVPAEVYRAVPDLRGLQSGFAYVFRDNIQMVRITGPAVPVVVSLTSATLYLKRVLFEGLLVKCIAAIVTVRIACDIIMNVTGIGKNEARAEDDEYIRSRSDIPMGEKSPAFSKDRRTRSFIIGRDRGGFNRNLHGN